MQTFIYAKYWVYYTIFRVVGVHRTHACMFLWLQIFRLLKMQILWSIKLRCKNLKNMSRGQVSYWRESYFSQKIDLCIRVRVFEWDWFWILRSTRALFASSFKMITRHSSRNLECVRDTIKTSLFTSSNRKIRSPREG